LRCSDTSEINNNIITVINFTPMGNINTKEIANNNSGDIYII